MRCDEEDNDNDNDNENDNNNENNNDNDNDNFLICTQNQILSADPTSDPPGGSEVTSSVLSEVNFAQTFI